MKSILVAGGALGLIGIAWGGSAFGAETRLQSSAACVPLCERDTSPCDPIYFKMGDGRCMGYSASSIKKNMDLQARQTRR